MPGTRPEWSLVHVVAAGDHLEARTLICYQLRAKLSSDLSQGDFVFFSAVLEDKEEEG